MGFLCALFEEICIPLLMKAITIHHQGLQNTPSSQQNRYKTPKSTPIHIQQPQQTQTTTAGGDYYW